MQIIRMMRISANKEVQTFSKVFKILFCTLFVIYLAFWLFTMHLANIQKREGIKPLLPVLYQDSHEYADLAQSLILGHFIQPGEVVETLRAPGYPAFTALFYLPFRSYFLVTFVQVILVFFSALIIRRLGILFSTIRCQPARLTPWEGEVSAILFLLNPMTLNLSLVILTDILFLFLRRASPSSWGN